MQFWPAGVPAARPIQEATLNALIPILSEATDSDCVGNCVAVVQPPGTGKTWIYWALQCTFRCIVVVLLPLVPLLDEAEQSARAAGLRAFRIQELSANRGDLRPCLVFCSFEAAASAAVNLISEALTENQSVIVVVDEAHMVHLDAGSVGLLFFFCGLQRLTTFHRYRPKFRSVWELGSRFSHCVPFVLLTATMRPSLETEVRSNPPPTVTLFHALAGHI